MLRCRATVKQNSDEPLILDGETRVLIAEDDDPLRDMLETILRLEGHHVTTVSSATDILQKVKDDFDVILTDVRMPGVSGLDVVATLRNSGHQIPIIVMTAFPDDGTRLRAEALGTVLIAKPFSLNAICMTIAGLILRKRGGRSAWQPS